MSTVNLTFEKQRTIQTANLGIYREGVLHPDRIAEYHDFFLVLEGGWEVLEDGMVFVLKPWDVLFLFQGKHHGGKKPCLQNTKTIYIHLSPEHGDRFIAQDNAPVSTANISLSSLTHLAGKDLGIKRLFEEIVYSFWSHSEFNRKRARALVTLLLIELSRNSSREQRNPAAMPVRYVMEELERNPSRNYSLDELAAMVSMNTRVLTTRFRALAGTSVKQFHLAHKIRVAASILDSMPSTTLHALADSFGFTDEYHFSHCFKKIMGVSPALYRSRNKELSGRA
jgi:AraC-like DNA-binding protein